MKQINGDAEAASVPSFVTVKKDTRKIIAWRGHIDESGVY
jgi:hypothetical protein